jgi:hypothetical protein
MPTTDLPPTPEERFHEVAAILAAGLPQIAATEDIPGEHAIPPESSESVQKSLGFPAPLRTNVHIG